MEIYYAIMNILDYLALHERLNEFEKDILYEMCETLVKFQSEDRLDFIHTCSDANDCGICESFQEMVIELRKLFKSGERITIGREING